MGPRALDVPHRVIAFAVFAVAIAAAGSAKATLPSYVAPGFPLETLDPAPAGDRFLVTPDAAIASTPASVRAITDFAIKPLQIQSPGGTTSGSTDWYAHLGLAAAPCDFFLLSADLPIVLNQGLTLQAPSDGLTGPLVTAPSPGDLGDMRIGARIRLTSRRAEHWAAAIASDFWLTTGNATTLSGEPSPRFRAQAILGGGFPAGPFHVELGGALGYQQFTSSADGYGVSRGIPVRLGLGAGLPVGAAHVRAALEYFGTPVAEGTGGVERTTGEGLLSAFFTIARVTVGLSAGKGLTDAPGVPEWRGMLSFQYQALSDDRPVTHAATGR